MTCSEVATYLNRTHQSTWNGLPSQVREHLSHCDYCRALWEFLTEGHFSEKVSPELRSRIEKSIQESLEPVRPLPSMRVLTLAFLLIFGLLSAVFVGWSGTQGAMDMGWVAFAGMLGVVGAAALLAALTLSREMVPGEKRLLSPPTLFLLLLLPLFITVALLFPWDLNADILPQSWKCFRAGFIFSLPAAGLVVLLLRRGAVFSLGVVGAGAGLLAGLVGTVVLHFGCGMHNAAHIALAHLGIPLFGTVAGGLIGKLIERMQR